MNPFLSLHNYEVFVYTLQARFSHILCSTLIVERRGHQFAELNGELLFRDGYRMAAYERLTWSIGRLTIEGYSYEIWRGGEKLYWYDSQPHPDDESLRMSHPHHKHVPPDMKHHRIAAAELSFEKPNLPFLLDEIARMIEEM